MQIPENIHLLILESEEEWKEHRTLIGGSDASCIPGVNPFKTNVQLWEEKIGIRTAPDISDKPFIKYGHEAEPLLRKLFELDFPQYKVGYQENNLWLNDRFPFAHASLDGLLEDSEGRTGILEIKTTNILQSMQKEKWKDRIPDNYYIQVLHYMMVLEADFAVLKAQLKFDFSGEIMLQTKHYHIERNDVADDIRYLENLERDFWNKVRTKERPALLLPDI